MKKIILALIIFSFALLTGCTLGNTPTSKTEDLLSRYQMLDKSISISYTDLANDSNLSSDIKKDYEDLIKKQYRNLSYEVKEEKIDGDTATVTVQVKVMNYKDAIKKYNKADYSADKYHSLVIDNLKNTKETTTYTIDFTLTKDAKNNWVTDKLTRIEEEKLLGIN